MNLKSPKIFVPIILVVVIILLSIAYLLWFDRANDYFVIIDGPLKIGEGSPVMIEKVRAGEIDLLYPRLHEADNYVVRFSLSKEYSIPQNSEIRVVYPGNESGGYIAIDVRASRNYFQPGDTVFKGKPTLLQADPSEGATRSRHGSNGDAALVYRVQVMVSATGIPLASEYFNGLEDVEQRYANGQYKYYTGHLKTHAEAEELRKAIVSKGILDAFVVPFLDDQRISIHEAMEYEK